MTNTFNIASNVYGCGMMLAWLEGEQAGCLFGQTANDCPYAADSAAATEWLAGLAVGRDENGFND